MCVCGGGGGGEGGGSVSESYSEIHPYRAGQVVTESRETSIVLVLMHETGQNMQ